MFTLAEDSKKKMHAHYMKQGKAVYQDKKRNFREAFKWFRETIKLFPEQKQGLKLLAQVLNRGAFFPLNLDDYEIALEIDENCRSAMYALGAKIFSAAG